MENLPIILLALACPIGMGLMMLFMGRGMMGMRRSRDQAFAPPADGPPADPNEQLAVLLGERELVDAQIPAAGQIEGGEQKRAMRRALDGGRPEGS